MTEREPISLTVAHIRLAIEKFKALKDHSPAIFQACSYNFQNEYEVAVSCRSVGGTLFFPRSLVDWDNGCCVCGEVPSDRQEPRDEEK